MADHAHTTPAPTSRRTAPPAGGATSRRALFGGAAALAAAPVLAAPPINPDAELIRLCGEHMQNFRLYNTEGGRLPTEHCPLWAVYSRTLDAICATRAHTLEGVIAKARVAVVEATMRDGSVEHDSIGGLWALGAAQDLVRIQGRA